MLCVLLLVNALHIYDQQSPGGKSLKSSQDVKYIKQRFLRILFPPLILLFLCFSPLLGNRMGGNHTEQGTFALTGIGQRIPGVLELLLQQYSLLQQPFELGGHACSRLNLFLFRKPTSSILLKYLGISQGLHTPRPTAVRAIACLSMQLLIRNKQRFLKAEFCSPPPK